MHEKLVAACITVAAFAALAAPPASASPVLTENFTPLAVGASVTAVNTGVNTFTAGEGLTTTCTAFHWVGSVLQNSGTNIKIEVPKGARFSDTGGAGSCTSASGEYFWSFNTKLCLETVPKTDNITVTGCGANVAFSIGNCEYSAASMTGTFATNSDATITLGEQPFKRIKGLFVVGSFPCPTTAKIDLLFDLTTTNGATLSIS
jgi:hypothetical protein